MSRCKCEFFYAGYGESSIDPSTVDEVPQPPSDEGGPWEKRERAVDAFTLMHHDLDVCTNSLQVLIFIMQIHSDSHKLRERQFLVRVFTFLSLNL